MKVKYFLSREELKANQTYLIPSEDNWANLLHVRWIVLSIIVHAAGHHWHEQQAQATGQALYSRESTVGWTRKDWKPQMTVAKVTASPGNEQMTKFREFSFTSQRYKAFNLQKKNMKWYYSVRKNSEPVTVHLVKSLKVLNRSVLSIQKLGRVWRSRSFSRQKHVFIRRRDLCPQGVFVFKSKLNRVLLGQSKLVAPEEGLVSERKHQANIFNSLFVIWF